MSDDETTKTLGKVPSTKAVWLMVLDDNGVRTHQLPLRGKVTIGRASDCDVVIEQESLSRRHAALWTFGGDYAIEDLGSHNGTRVGDRSAAPGEKLPVQIGNAITVGNATLVLQAEPAIARPRLAQDGDTLVARVAATDINVLILGESGVGKEVMAATLHERSARAPHELVSVSCAAFTEALLGAELFGYERGALAGTDGDKPGVLENADGGTVFLDDVEQMPPAVQAKLLRVIEQQAVQRIGAARPRPIDVRFFAATKRDLEAEVREGRFRQDLLYRLNGITITVPPLRLRTNELERIAHELLQRAAARMSLGVPRLGAPAWKHLRAHSWPGNVRELSNILARALVLCTGDTILPEHLPLSDNDVAPRLDRRTNQSRSINRDHERAAIVEALERSAGSQPEAAKLLGISLRTLVSRLNEYDIPRGRRK